MNKRLSYSSSAMWRLTEHVGEQYGLNAGHPSYYCYQGSGYLYKACKGSVFSDCAGLL